MLWQRSENRKTQNEKHWNKNTKQLYVITKHGWKPMEIISKIPSWRKRSRRDRGRSSQEQLISSRLTFKPPNDAVFRNVKKRSVDYKSKQNTKHWNNKHNRKSVEIIPKIPSWRKRSRRDRGWSSQEQLISSRQTTKRMLTTNFFSTNNQTDVTIRW